MNTKKVHRIYNESGLQLRDKTPKRRVKAKLRDDRWEALEPNETWAMDFVHDQFTTGKKIRVLTVVDTFSRVSPVLDPRFSYRGEDVLASLEQTCATVGYPRVIRVDQGSEFCSDHGASFGDRYTLVLTPACNPVAAGFGRAGRTPHATLVVQ